MKNFYQSYHSSRFTILLDNTYTIHCPSQKICSMLVSAIIIEIDAAIVKDKEQQDLHVSKPSWERDATTHVANSPTSSPICQTDVNYGCQNFTTLRYTDPESYPMTMLASYPGSGNTWMRVLLSSLTGKNPTDRSFLGLWNNLKAHLFTNFVQAPMLVVDAKLYQHKLISAFFTLLWVRPSESCVKIMSRNQVLRRHYAGTSPAFVCTCYACAALKPAKLNTGVYETSAPTNRRVNIAIAYTNNPGLLLTGAEVIK